MGRFEKVCSPGMAGTFAESDNVVASRGAEGGSIEMPWARILARISPMQVSATASRRFVLSTFSLYNMMSKTASDSFLLTSMDSKASIWRSNRALVRIWLAAAACSAELPDENFPGGCFLVNMIWSNLKGIYVPGHVPQGCGFVR